MSSTQHEPSNALSAENAADSRLATTSGPFRRRDDIQGLRAVAVVSVMIFHATQWLPGGYVGVDVFFVVSGFVITGMLAREWKRNGGINFARFYVRRFKRLTPALMLVLTFTLVVSAVVVSPVGGGGLSPQETVAATALGAAFLVANVVIARTTGGYFDSEADTNPLLHTWSLSVEEQFYLVFPALLGLSWLAARRRRWSPEIVAGLVVAFVGTASLLLAVMDSRQVSLLPDSLVGFYGPAARVWEFAAGALLSLLQVRIGIRSTRIATALGAAGAALLAVSVLLLDDRTPFPSAWTAIPVAGTLFLIVAGAQPRNRFSRFLSAKAMVNVGDLSYSLYLWHWPFIAFAGLLWPRSPAALAWAAALSVVPAVASYHLVEQPLRNSTMGGRRLLGAGTTVVLVPVLLSGGILAAVAVGYGDENVRRYQAGIGTPHLSSAAGCIDQSWERLAQCTWNASPGGRPVYLVGDSHADQFSEALLGAAQAAGRELRVIGQVGCTYAAVIFASPDRSIIRRCQDYSEGAQQYLLGAQPGTVVIANSYLWWANSSGVAVSLPGDSPTSDLGRRLLVLEAGLSATVRDLKRAGHDVVLVQPIPQWGDTAGSLSWATCSISEMRNRGCGQSQSLDHARERQRAIWNVVRHVSHVQLVGLLDLGAQICPNDICESVTSDGFIRYRDGTHITVQQGEALAGSFAAALAGGP